MSNILDKINSPSDLKNLKMSQMPGLAQEIRDAIIKRSNTISGHLGPDLGIVEAIMALHYVFDSPRDKIVLDVSHQCYPHKILTGRSRGFTNPVENIDISGYSNPNESEHDHFIIGHTSTSVTLATGMAKARDLQGGHENVIALIGDGSLSGGEALEGLNNAAVLNSNIIIILNDNEMSIAENQGGLYSNLAHLRETKGHTDKNIFTSIGYNYLYVEEGNNFEVLVKAFDSVKDTDCPTVVHIHTQKGKGLKVAEENKEAFHWIMPHGIDDFGKTSDNVQETYTSMTTDYFLEKKKTCPELLVKRFKRK